MGTEELSRKTSINIQETANLIWAISEQLAGAYEPHEYGNVILPMCAIKRFSDVLAETPEVHEDSVSEYQFYNTSKVTFKDLLADPDNIANHFRDYLNHFSSNVIDIIEKFGFDKEITKMDRHGILYNVISEFCSPLIYMGADKISAIEMGKIFMRLVRKFSESYDEQAGVHFTACDIVSLMAEILVAPQKEQMTEEGITATMYDMAMGTSQMLNCLSEKIYEIDPDAQLTEFGQEINEQTYAIAKANMLIKSGDADNMKLGNTLNDDQFEGYQFDYIISNPPFGLEWKNERKDIEAEHQKGEMGRFAPGLPSIRDSQLLFVLNGAAKLKDTGRMAIIQNNTSLFRGNAGTGESDIRGYLLENDWLETIIRLPDKMFYNTPIMTCIWIVTKNKSPKRVNKVQLIDASKCYQSKNRLLGLKRNELTQECIELITKAYNAFDNGTYKSGNLIVNSKIQVNDDFKYNSVIIESPSNDLDKNAVLKNGKSLTNASSRRSEHIPWKENIQEYMKKYILPYEPDAWIDGRRTQIGYEIPFFGELNWKPIGMKDGFTSLPLRVILKRIHGKAVTDVTQCTVITSRDLPKDVLTTFQPAKRQESDKNAEISVGKNRISSFPFIPRKIEEDVILVSEVANPNPTICHASPEQPIYISNSLAAYKIIDPSFHPGYLCMLIWEMPEIPFSLRSFNQCYSYIDIAFPGKDGGIDYEMQENIYNTYIQTKQEALVKEAGLNNYIQKLKTDYENELRVKRHDMSPHLSQLIFLEKNIRSYLKRDNKDDLVEYLTTKMDKMHNAVNCLSEMLKNLLDEKKYDEPEGIDIFDYFDSFKNTIEYESRYEIQFSIDSLSLEDVVLKGQNQSDKHPELSVFISRSALDSIVNNIIDNAVHHGFTDINRSDYFIKVRISALAEKNMIQIDFSNNGTPFPTGLDKEQYGLKGIKAGTTGRTGLGGHQVKETLEHYGGDYDIFSDTNLSTISIYLPLIKN